MIISENKVVAVSYELRVDDFEGEVVEVADNNKPLEFLFGRGNMLEKFEVNLNDKKAGDTFKFKIECNEAYGQVNDEAIIDLPKQYVPDDPELIKVDNLLPLQDEAGNRFVGKILEISDEYIKIDLNHPMAGEDLYFSGEVLSVREATEEEKNHGHLHGAQNDCGCGCESDCDTEECVEENCNDGNCGCN